MLSLYGSYAPYSESLSNEIISIILIWFFFLFKYIILLQIILHVKFSNNIPIFTHSKTKTYVSFHVAAANAVINFRYKPW